MNNKKIIFSIFIFFLLCIASNICLAKDLDNINKYYITVDPRKDGTLDMTYYLEWEVLDSDSEGPLEWVKIGIPNSNVDLIRAISDNIKSVKYYKEYGDYIRVDFKKAYYAGEVVEFSFSFHQSYMYDLDADNAKYSFIPGWFNDIAIEKIIVFWNSKDVLEASSKKVNSDGYYIWESSLKKGSKMPIEVSYRKSSMNFNEEAQTGSATKYTSSTSSYDSDSGTLFMTIIFIVAMVFIALGGLLQNGSYNSHRGYGYSNSHSSHSSHHHSSCASSCACVSSCACACACAGGGRAGCSKKDFYGITIRTKKLNKVIKENPE